SGSGRVRDSDTCMYALTDALLSAISLGRSTLRQARKYAPLISLMALAATTSRLLMMNTSLLVY
ncbi:hypothetical protein PMAYCL1PPCAC_09346, partial [Pristionchus mayeri]